MILGAFPKSAICQESTKDTEKKFEPKEAILEHIGDSHSWPVLGKTSIPLPVILYTDKGLELFSSANVKEEEVNGQPKEKVYQGEHYSLYPGKGQIKVVGSNGEVDPVASKKCMGFFYHPQCGEFVDVGHYFIVGFPWYQLNL